jgi:hypothetical protein
MIISQLEIWRLLYDFRFNYKEIKNENINSSEVKMFLEDYNIKMTDSKESVTSKLLDLFGVDENDLDDILREQIGLSLHELINSNEKVKKSSEVFADIVLSYWGTKLTSISIKDKYKSNKMISKNNEAMNSILTEIVKSHAIIKVKTQIIEIIETDLGNDISKEHFDFVASCISGILNRYVFSASWAFVDEKHKPLNIRKEPIFSNNSIIQKDRIITKEILEKSNKNYIKDFSFGVKELYKENIIQNSEISFSFDSIANQKIEKILIELSNK